MNPDRRFDQVAVIGAAGKMGRGISAILAACMVEDSFKEPTAFQKNLFLLDLNFQALQGAKAYIYEHGVKFAEKNIQKLRQYCQQRTDLVENVDIIQEFSARLRDLLCATTSMKDLAECDIVFEAALEIEDLKCRIFSELRQNCPSKTLFFSNTSSIPIHVLEETCHLQGRMVGFHFYNPPPVQVLLEMITTETTPREVREHAKHVAGRLKKKVVEVNDVAGFIGNGQFIRESISLLRLYKDLSADLPAAEAMLALDTVTRDWLMRPMGAFQLMDYIGLDVFAMIVKVMARHTPDEDMSCELVDELLSRKINGGQNVDGTQKDGFFCYKGLKISGVLDFDKGVHMELEGGMRSSVEQWLGPHPLPGLSWKSLSRSANKHGDLVRYFEALKAGGGNGAKLALQALQGAGDIAGLLLKKYIAPSASDINRVMMMGFHHLYGPLWDLRGPLDEN